MKHRRRRRRFDKCHQILHEAEESKMDKKCQVSNVVLSDSFLTKLNFISEMLFNLL